MGVLLVYTAGRSLGSAHLVAVRRLLYNLGTMKHAGGRPTKYTENMPERVLEYLKECQDEYDEFHKTRGEKSDSFERVLTVKLPTTYGFAKFIGVDETTIYEWEKNHPLFSQSLDKIKAEQRQRLLQKGLSGEYNPVIAKLILSANHDMREKSDMTTDGKAFSISFDDSFKK